MIFEVAKIILAILFGIGVVAGSLFLYFLPTYFAYQRNHPNRWMIFWINLFLGGSGVVWIICLVWALSEKKK